MYSKTYFFKVFILVNAIHCGICTIKNFKHTISKKMVKEITIGLTRKTRNSSKITIL